MSNELAIDRKSTALVLLDFQRFVLHNFLGEAGRKDVVEAAATLLAAARSAKLEVIHVIVAFRPGFPEISPRNSVFSWLRDSGLVTPGCDGVGIDRSLVPTEVEPVVTKHRVGAFSGTDFERILRAKGIETLILAGVSTSGTILSTVRQAFDLDYRMILARDACADGDGDIHDMLFDRVLPHHAHVSSVAAISAALEEHCTETPSRNRSRI